ncbi:hypothetical protein F2Q68_00003512 [Brassica cretica]|uniref:Uncharacterized protein n=2 Tax=Brassica cretica TaxID=69181 RepID=A0ABQ7C8B4_BRACR|nr:hypothetical protein F2Q68_00003512 [Brassica cretica]KAF3547837.1 hypothetical protein DY000_02005088 [Brassica cretica]
MKLHLQSFILVLRLSPDLSCHHYCCSYCLKLSFPKREQGKGPWKLLELKSKAAELWEHKVLRLGTEKYLGLITGRKYVGRIEIKQIAREARGVLTHGIRTWCQSPSKLSVYRSSRCHRAWKLDMQVNKQKHEVLTCMRSTHASGYAEDSVSQRLMSVHAEGHVDVEFYVCM